MKHAVVLSLFALSCASAPRVDHPTLELTVPEIAETVGVPFDTAKSRLRLAMKKLRARAQEVDRASRSAR